MKLRMILKRQVLGVRAVALVLAVAVIAACTGCDSNSTKLASSGILAQAAELTGEVEEPDIGSSTFRNGYLSYALTLFSKVYAKNDGSTVMSPLSVMYALGMAENGAEGETLADFEKVFGVSREEMNRILSGIIAWTESNKKLNVANSLWIKDGFAESVKQDFLKRCSEGYRSTVFKTAFDGKTLEDVNKWISDNTDKMIPKMLDSLPAGTVMMLVNAILFDQKWEKPFNKENTQKGEPFLDKNGNKIREVDLMHGSATNYYYRDELCTSVDKYYEDGDFSFRILVPEAGVGVEDLMAALTAEYWTKIGDYANRKEAMVTLEMPAFSYETSVGDMDKMLQEMGLARAFGPGADFTGICDGGLCIDKVIHKARIEVNEEGTRAAAATVVTMKVTAVAPPEERITVRADHPFVYAIMYQGIPVFLGTYE